MPNGDVSLNIYIAIVLIGAIGYGIWSGFFALRKIQPGSFKWKRLRTELLLMVMTLTVSATLLVWVRQSFDAAGWIQFCEGQGAWWQIALEYALYFFAFDTWFYWWHRLMHREPFYKWIHKVHHWSTAPNPITTFSETPFEAIINGIFLTLFVAVVPVHDITMALIVPTAVIMGLYVHSGHEFLPRFWNRSWLTKWFITATFHDQHHKYFRYNYGGYTPIWDYICGTNRPKYDADWEKLKDRSARSRRVQEDAVAAEQ